MTDEATIRTEAIQKAAQCRERAGRYESLADEARQRGDFEMSTQFSSRAAEEWLEARRIEESLANFGQTTGPTSDR
jgi:DICT domain-containing protein